MVVIGDKEVEERMISVRDRAEGDLGTWERTKLLDIIRAAAL